MDNLVNKKILAIIPARGGSKRIPKKNILDFEGKPMIAWTIEAALKSNIFTDVIVSTDDEEIGKISEKNDATFLLRTTHADDHSNVSDVVYNVLNNIEKKYDIVVMLMANCPLRDENDIKNALTNFIKLKSNFQISSFKFGWMNPWWAHTINSKTNIAKPLFDTKQARSQDLEDLHCPTGAIWIANVEELKKSKTFYGTNYTMFDMNWKNAVDIDDYEDLEFAKLLFNMKKDNEIPR